MNGHIIEGTPIAVDFWKIRECPNVKLFFLSHVHDDHTKGLTPSWRFPLYTSMVSAKLLAHFVKVPVHLVKALEVGTSHLISLGETGEESMTVTLIDARHCPGAVMFLFEGYFGNFLYTGDFRYDSDMADDPAFTAFPPIDRLYLDNTYCSPSCTHPTRQVACEKILETIRAHPPNTRVLFGLTRVGKEDLLVNIAQELKEWVVVDPEAYKKMQILEMSNVFTVDDDTSRIRALPFHLLNRPNFQHQGSDDKPFIIILPSSIMGSDFRPPYGSKNNVYSMPYSNHSSFPELAAFVSKVRPRCIIPIVIAPEARADMSAFENLLDPTPCKLFQTPHCVENWNVVRGSRKIPLVTPKRKRMGAPTMRKGVSFIDEDSYGSKESGKDGGKPLVGDQQENGAPKPQSPRPSKQASRDSITDSDCDSDSGIFAVLKKLKPQPVCENRGDLTNKIEGESPLLTAANEASTGLMSGTEITRSDKSTRDVAKVDAEDTKLVGSADAFSEELIKPPARPDPSLEPGAKPLHFQITAIKETSKKVDKANLTHAAPADEIFIRTNDITALDDRDSATENTSDNVSKADSVLVDSADAMSAKSNDSPVLQKEILAIRAETCYNKRNSATKETSEGSDEINSSLLDSPSASNLFSLGESSSVKAPSQEEHDSTIEFIGSSQVSTSNVMSGPLFDDDAHESGKKTSINVVELPKCLGAADDLGTSGPEAETLVESETGNNSEQGEVSDIPNKTKSALKGSAGMSGDEKGDNVKRDEAPEGTIGSVLPGGGSGELSAVINLPWKPEACLCKAKWKLEEALQEAMAYVKGDSFRPFVYPDEHVCLL